MHIRTLTPEDGEAAAAVFFDAVHNGTADVYSVEQRRAWAGDAPDPARWRKRFADISGFAAEADGVLGGFMTLDAEGYIDLAFVKAALAGHGVGRALYARIEKQARTEGIAQLTTEASKKARPFFARMGWRVDTEQVVVRNGTALVNYKMSKSLERPQ
ncbi:GNAT family N-acetyltransferase [Pseudosulfitobacter sp. DSM 107133]|uniref:GNAT family N-acetyltransferase n=1 Tax=Pseudosulfitobacter sp. DSM 107133 TaxID=2883100 RepID=UPI001F07EA49|nr:GNAT family N-acetyltransferase [Pseudosulfitobacter sp. DSM 107133]UOA28640.1 putative N-acetyltransferase YafP [Pseudosulfitobacter sp. DSM 107133]